MTFTKLSTGVRALAAGVSLAGLAATGAVAADAGYVASLAGAAEIEGADRSRAELSFLDLLPEGSRLHLEAGAELRVCLSATGAISGVSGPAVLLVSARDLVAESGRAPARTGERCNPPLVSRTQGGSAFRSLNGPSLAIGVRSWLRVVPATTTAVRKATLLSPDEKVRLSEFQTISVSPVVLSAGLVYPLVIEFSDGRKITVRLAAQESMAADVAVINVSP